MSAKESARRRILDAARLLVARGGAAEISMGEVAQAAGVSKALVHYHFGDKDTLLRALVDHVGHMTLERERAALAGGARRHALDDYWEWFEEEIQRGDIRILVALGEYDSEVVRAAGRTVAHARRDLASEHVALVFSQLGLTPRVPAAIVADTLTAFLDGIAAAHGLEPERNPRPAFDVLWLALLTLADS